jgi:OmpA-OmpF porin, OOP family
MSMTRSILRCTAALAGALLLSTGSSAAETVDMGQAVPDAQAVKEGLFPEDTCKELEAAGYKCMGFKPAVRFSLPTANFKLGSAELPDLLRKQLDVFAEVLRGKKGTGRVVRIEGHADASGTSEVNQALSQRRAEAVRGYLVQQGAEQTMLQAVGLGSSAPKNSGDPFAAENRRVEIGRQTAP